MEADGWAGQEAQPLPEQIWAGTPGPGDPGLLNLSESDAGCLRRDFARPTGLAAAGPGPPAGRRDGKDWRCFCGSGLASLEQVWPGAGVDPWGRLHPPREGPSCWVASPNSHRRLRSPPRLLPSQAKQPGSCTPQHHFPKPPHTPSLAPSPVLLRTHGSSRLCPSGPFPLPKTSSPLSQGCVPEGWAPGSAVVTSQTAVHTRG